MTQGGGWKDERPDPVDLLRQISQEGRRRAISRVYLGYAAGCGATTAMLDEARRRVGRGTDVVVAAYGLHGDPAAALSGLEVLGAGRSRAAEQPLDLEAVLARNPEVVCIDDLAARDLQGRLRIEAMPRLLEAGITVLATVHVLAFQNVASAMAEALGGELPEPLLDDGVIDLLDELEIVDLPPADLLERIRAGSVLTPARLAQAMQREMRMAILSMLRETALRMVAEHADQQLTSYLPAQDLQGPWEFRRRIVLCLPVAPGLDDRIRWAFRYAEAGDTKLTVAVVRTRHFSDQEMAWMGSYTSLVTQLGGRFVILKGRSVAATVAGFVAESQATEVILGHRRRTRWVPWDTTTNLIRRVCGIDVHILRA